MQGLGNALLEEIVFEDGLLVNPSMLEYRVPSMLDLPDSMTCIIVENADGPGPVRREGLRRGLAGGDDRRRSRPRVADAGVPVTELPLTPERVWRSIQKLQKESRMGTVNRAAIIGTGTMGPGMGAVLARSGIQTALYDISADALERAKGGVALAQGALDRLDAVKADGGGITYESDLAAALEGVDLVIEAAPERLDIKQELFAEFEKHVPAGAILASNTSGIPITKIAADLASPERVIGMHWSNPPHFIPMIEVIPGEKTSQATVDATVAARRRTSATTRSSSARCRDSSRTGSCTRSCASASTWSTAGSSIPPASTPTCAGASATSSR